ncbi:uncharacterized protein LOC119163157 isoform X3 [Rhipicephalus microplus]|uniref:uncharacterized protein LOC119163157 isoform X3 n=1 Tax=Rhipicephalus microplus TaxID=6941 RepID=UPI003F6ABACD
MPCALLYTQKFGHCELHEELLPGVFDTTRADHTSLSDKRRGWLRRMGTVSIARHSSVLLLFAALVSGKGGGNETYCDKQDVAVCYWGFADRFGKIPLLGRKDNKTSYLTNLCLSVSLDMKSGTLEDQVPEQNRGAQNLKGCVEAAVKTCGVKKHHAAISHLLKIADAIVELSWLPLMQNAAYPTKSATAAIAACLLGLAVRSYV